MPDEHLTTEQLSALLDKHYSAQEQAAYDAHLRSCEQCQRELANLRQTVALLQALPPPELPRSFVLPLNTQQGTRATAGGASVVPLRRNAWQRTIRVMSTFVAVLGVIFVLSGVCSPLFTSHGGTTTAASTNNPAVLATPQAPSETVHSTATKLAANDRTATAQARVIVATPTEAPIAPHTSGIPSSTDQATVPPLLDITMSLGRVVIGTFVLLLGLLGLLLTRRRLSRS